MAKTKKAATPDTVLTVTLPGEGGIQRVGTISARRGELATLSSFTYSSIADIADAIGEAAARLVSVEREPPKLDPKATGWKDYKPDLEAKRKLLVIGATVKTKEGQVGTLVENPNPEASVEPDTYFVDIGKEVDGTYKLEDLTPVTSPVSDAPGDPLAVAGQVKQGGARPKTDVAPKSEQPAQLALI